MMITYEIQYSICKKKLWVHSSKGETVARYDTRFGMDIHSSIEEQQNGASQCLMCTHGKSNLEEFKKFCNKVYDLWKIEIDKNKIEFV